MSSLCELDKLEYPPLGELAHKEAHCYCYRCTCGKHHCPSTYNPQLGSPQKLRSSYRRDFVSKTGETPKQYVRQGELAHSKNPMEFRTTQQETFKDFSERIATKQRDQRPSLRKTQFTSRSIYQDSFASWQCHPFIRVTAKVPYNPSPLKIRGSTTYSTSFDLNKCEPPNRVASATGSYRPLIGVDNFRMMESTHSTFYKPFSKDKTAVKNRRKSEEFVTMESPRKHFATTYTNNFVTGSPQKQVPTQRQMNKMSMVY